MRQALLFILIIPFLALGQDSAPVNKGQFSGNFVFEGQFYVEDSVIGATTPDEKIGINSYGNFNYVYSNFSAGLRFESYMPAKQGYSSQLNGTGIPYKFIKFKKDNIEVVLGSFYEQFGNGIVLRAYEEKTLGYDNAFEGGLIKYQLNKYGTFKILYGTQRNYWDFGKGLVRGIDGDFSINELFSKNENPKSRLNIGGSFVSKYQEDTDPLLVLPENVANVAGRFNFRYKKFSLDGEYAHKINDPSADNNFIYKDGRAAFLNTTYSKKGLGVLVSLKSLDNMNFRSDRYATASNLMINYIPDLSKIHSYSLTAMYPYASQATGEAGMKAEIFYKIKKKSKFGGKYGTGINISYSQMNALNRSAVNDTTAMYTSGTDGYKTSLTDISDEVYYKDFSVEINKKMSKKLKGIFVYQFNSYNNDILLGADNWKGDIVSHVGLVDLTYRIKPTKSIKTVFQHLESDDDKGSWISGLIEYSFPKYFISILEEYNYDNINPDKRVHYYYVSAGYRKGANRIQCGYGRQRSGITCTGGVCRNVPASNGFSISIISSF